MADYSQANELLSRAQSTSQEAIKATAGASGLQNTLRQAITERYGDPLSGQREQAAQTVLNSPTNARSYVADVVQGRGPNQAILSPTQQQSIIASRRAADVAPLMTLNDLLRMRTGGVDETINTGMSALQGLISAAQQQAQLYQNQGESMWDRLYKQDVAEQQNALERAKFDEGIRQYNTDMAYKMRNDGTGFGIGSLTGLSGITETKPSAPPKQYSNGKIDVSKPFNQGVYQTPINQNQNIFQKIWNGLFNPNQSWVNSQVKL